jgi:hypothetical protein
MDAGHEHTFVEHCSSGSHSAHPVEIRASIDGRMAEYKSACNRSLKRAILTPEYVLHMSFTHQIQRLIQKR